MLNALKKVILVTAVMLAPCLAHAAQVAYSGVFVGTEGLAQSTGSAVSATYTRNINTTGDRISFQMLHSSYSVAVSTNFGSGQYVLNTPTITITSNKFTTGMQVLFSTAGANVISGLTDQTTYFVSLLSANTLGVSNTFKLSSTLANATAGNGIVLASSSAATNRFTLAPLNFTNTSGGGLQLQSSDDGNNWTNLTTGNYGLAITSVTWSVNGGNTLYDLGAYNHKWLRAKVVPATTGAVNYTAFDNERYSTQQ
jgi:hypothetical protein